MDPLCSNRSIRVTANRCHVLACSNDIRTWCITANSWIIRAQQPPETHTLLIENSRWKRPLDSVVEGVCRPHIWLLPLWCISVKSHPHTSMVCIMTCTQGSFWQEYKFSLAFRGTSFPPDVFKKYRNWSYSVEGSPEISICLVSSNYLQVIRRQLSTCNVLNLKESGRITWPDLYSRYSGYIFIGAYRQRDGRPEHLVRFPPFWDFFSSPQPSKILGPRRIRSRVHLHNFAEGEVPGTRPNLWCQSSAEG